MMNIPVAKLMVGWFGSLFACNLSLQPLFRFWDLLFLEGEVMLFRLALFVFKKKDFRNKDSQAILQDCNKLEDLLSDYEFFDCEKELLSQAEFFSLKQKFK